MRKVLTATVFAAITGASALGFGATTAPSATTRACADHGGYTAPSGWKVGTHGDLGRDGVDACSDDGGLDGVVRAGIGKDGAGNDSAYVAVDTEGTTDDYVYATTGENQGIYCGAGRYDEPAGFDPELDDPQTRDAKRTDDC